MAIILRWIPPSLWTIRSVKFIICWLGYLTGWYFWGELIYDFQCHHYHISQILQEKDIWIRFWEYLDNRIRTRTNKLWLILWYNFSRGRWCPGQVLRQDICGILPWFWRGYIYQGVRVSILLASIPTLTKTG